jgi:hypothetical protein
MSKRPPLDLMALTSEQATPMPEASQRLPEPVEPAKPLPKSLTRHAEARTENLEPLAFKVPRLFRKRFKQCALSADLKLNELLFEALDAWEEKRKPKK